MIDPPGEETWFRRNVRAATRNRTPWKGPDEYVCTVNVEHRTLARALRSEGYRMPPLTTLKYVETRDGAIAWERGTLAAGQLDRGGENQHHAYWFDADDGRIHLHHHREWPTIGNPLKHQTGSRTYGDPEGRLHGALEDAGIAIDTVPEPAYDPGTA